MSRTKIHAFKTPTNYSETHFIYNSDVNGSSARLYKMRNLTGDVKFEIEGEEIPAHKCVLAALSPKYERQFYGDFCDKNQEVIEVNVPGLTADAFGEFLQFFYLDLVELSERNIESVMFLVKESLLESAYETCIEYLITKLSITNIYSRHSLATLYECSELLEGCEDIIKRRYQEIIAEKEFVTCDRAFLVKFLELITESTPKCKFEAKYLCDENGQDKENNANLRDAFDDDIVAQIKFETMTLDEFIELLEENRGFFTAEDKERIFRAISKETHFSPYWFDQKISESDSSTTIKYTIVDSEEPIDYVLAQSANGIVFSSYHRAYLDAFYFGQIFQDKGTNPFDSISVRVEVEEEDARHRTVHYSETDVVTCDSAINRFTLQEPIVIKPKCNYRIYFVILESRPFYVSVFKYKKLAMAYDFVIVCKSDAGLLSGLKLRFIKDKNN